MHKNKNKKITNKNLKNYVASILQSKLAVVVALFLAPLTANAGLVAYDYAGEGYGGVWTISGTFVLDETAVFPGDNLVGNIVSWEFSWTNGDTIVRTSSDDGSILGPDLSPDMNYYFVVDGDNEVSRVALESQPADGSRFPLFGFESDGSTWNASTGPIDCCVQGSGSFSAPRKLVESVGIEIKPGSDDNCGGVIPVAILGSDKLNVAQIDPATLSFSGLGIRKKGNGTALCGIEDVNADGFDDYVCKFENGETEGMVSGALLDGTAIEGSDSFCVAH